AHVRQFGLQISELSIVFLPLGGGRLSGFFVKHAIALGCCHSVLRRGCRLRNFNCRSWRTQGRPTRDDVSLLLPEQMLARGFFGLTARQHAQPGLFNFFRKLLPGFTRGCSNGGISKYHTVLSCSPFGGRQTSICPRGTITQSG